MIAFFAQHKAKFTDYAECPSKYRTETIADQMFKRKIRVFKAGSKVDGTFGNETSTSWDTFTKTLSEGKFDPIRTGTMFPKRKDLTDRFGHSTDELQMWQT